MLSVYENAEPTMKSGCQSQCFSCHGQEKSALSLCMVAKSLEESRSKDVCRHGASHRIAESYIAMNMILQAIRFGDC
ncbi:hypothetical protein Peur_035333 [Populus x canadensis]